MDLRPAYCLLAMLTVLVVGGCADSVPDAKPLQSITKLWRSYDNTLTGAEKEAAISDLQKEKERQQQQIGQSEAGGKTN